jgi:hypothetical protein
VIPCDGDDIGGVIWPTVCGTLSPAGLRPDSLPGGGSHGGIALFLKLHGDDSYNSLNQVTGTMASYSARTAQGACCGGLGNGIAYFLDALSANEFNSRNNVTGNTSARLDIVNAQGSAWGARAMGLFVGLVGTGPAVGSADVFNSRNAVSASGTNNSARLTIDMVQGAASGDALALLIETTAAARGTWYNDNNTVTGTNGAKGTMFITRMQGHGDGAGTPGATGLMIDVDAGGQDAYNSNNTVSPVPGSGKILTITNGLGEATGGNFGAFIHALASDVYNSNPSTGLTTGPVLLRDVHAVAPGGLALFADLSLGTGDTYTALSPTFKACTGALAVAVDLLDGVTDAKPVLPYGTGTLCLDL